MLAFRYVEQRNVRPNIIHVALDDYIPFCEYFIIPYLLWFFYVAATVIYFSFINQNKKDLWRYLKNADSRIYRKLYMGIIGRGVNLPGGSGRKTAVAIYKVVQKLYGFN